LWEGFCSADFCRNNNVIWEIYEWLYVLLYNVVDVTVYDWFLGFYEKFEVIVEADDVPPGICAIVNVRVFDVRFGPDLDFICGGAF
jgi:hypothetical protein